MTPQPYHPGDVVRWQCPRGIRVAVVLGCWRVGTKWVVRLHVGNGVTIVRRASVVVGIARAS